MPLNHPTSAFDQFERISYWTPKPIESLSQLSAGVFQSHVRHPKPSWRERLKAPGHARGNSSTQKQTSTGVIHNSLYTPILLLHLLSISQGHHFAWPELTEPDVAHITCAPRTIFLAVTEALAFGHPLRILHACGGPRGRADPLTTRC